jgi:sugar/nucleoside kinase (ribokinase family)
VVGSLNVVVVFRVRELPAPGENRVVVASGGGDALVGVPAAAPAQGRDPEHAVRLAAATASRSVAVEGVGGRYPDFTLETLSARRGESAALV